MTDTLYGLIGNSPAIYDHKCMDIIITKPNFKTVFSSQIQPVGFYINKLFKATFDDMKYYDFLNFNRKQDYNLKLKDLF